MNKYRVEKDSMGEVKVPNNRMYGAQTQRAVDNFEISQTKMPSEMIRAVILLKKAAALTNKELGNVDGKYADAIIKSADKLLASDFMGEFPIDLFQTGSGTSSNMNANEVLSNMANLLLVGPESIGEKKPVHPNDHVNWGQSSNCIMPSSVSVSNRLNTDAMMKQLHLLIAAFQKKATDWKDIPKIGRTHIQDAVPMSVGQEFGAFTAQLKRAYSHLNSVIHHLEEIPFGGSAIGTGLASHPKFGPVACKHLSEMTGIKFTSMENKFEGIAARDAQVIFMGAMNNLAVVLMKISNDLRLLTSGPRTGLGEITFPEVQPGSSIMPGKVNPVIAEMMIQVCAHIMGKTTSVTIAGQNAPLQLNIMIPLIGHETLSSIELMTNSMRDFRVKAIVGLVCNEEKCHEWIEWSSALVTPLKNHPKVGYDLAAKLAKQALHENKKIVQIIREQKILTEEEINQFLDPRKMI